ncbi:MAG: hypothetical protein Q4A71_00800 [Actinomycetaceae bacterium]|nr:hypothetical protein [Actinomycetaceae bacterium]
MIIWVMLVMVSALTPVVLAKWLYDKTKQIPLRQFLQALTPPDIPHLEAPKLHTPWDTATARKTKYRIAAARQYQREERAQQAFARWKQLGLLND